MSDCTLIIGIYLESWSATAKFKGHGDAFYRGRGIYFTCRKSSFLGLGNLNSQMADFWGDQNFEMTGKWVHVTAVYKDDYCIMYLDREKSKTVCLVPYGFKQLESTSSWVKELKVFDKALSDEEVFALSDQFHRNCIEQTEE